MQFKFVHGLYQNFGNFHCASNPLKTLFAFSSTARTLRPECQIEARIQYDIQMHLNIYYRNCCQLKGCGKCVGAELFRNVNTRRSYWSSAEVRVNIDGWRRYNDVDSGSCA
jgi:hypothetical protein